MIIVPHNFNPSSDSGPNSFTSRLFRVLSSEFDCEFTHLPEIADIEFCLIQEAAVKSKPRITRLDGIYFNTGQNYQEQNRLIKKTYDSSDAVIFQSRFNKKLIEKWFGCHKGGHVIHNGPAVQEIDIIPALDLKPLTRGGDAWFCASSWRPHKRLRENIRYFLDFSPDDSVLIVAGKGVSKDEFSDLVKGNESRIFYVGHLDRNMLVGLGKSCSTFIHLAYLDHCPNVVVDARAAGCKIVCSSTGGTSEIAGIDAVVIEEDEWDFSPVDLYNPPPMNFSNVLKENKCSIDISPLRDVSEEYYKIMEKIK
tara:strand:+ start:1460 stop:2386 length:927 start_codon:yes stop_codon:yes gene_type:complete